MKHEIESLDNEVPTNRESFLAMVSKTGDEAQHGWIHAFSVRAPMTLAMQFEAMAQHSGKSRNLLIVKALQVAVDELWQELPQDDCEAIEAIYRAKMGEALAAKAGMSGEV